MPEHHKRGIGSALVLPPLPGSKRALRAQFLTASVLACHCEPVISACGSRVWYL
jgi:hypothetical protein